MEILIATQYIAEESVAESNVIIFISKEIDNGNSLL